jgi:hypothetical protein
MNNALRARPHRHLAMAFACCFLALIFNGAESVLAAENPGTAPPAPRKLSIANRPWTGDFDKMLERRVIRVYAPFSRSLYFSDKGRERGLAVELVRDWERYINVKYAMQLGKRPLTIYIAPRHARQAAP